MLTRIYKLLSLIILMTVSGTAVSDQDIIITSDPNNRPLHAIATLISRNLIAEGINSTLIDSNYSTLNALDNASLLINTGDKLSRQIGQRYPDTPQINIVTRHHPDITSGIQTQIVINQHICMQLSLIHQLSTSFMGVSVIASNSDVIKGSERCAKKYGMRIHLYLYDTGSSLHSLIENALNNDILLTIPDSKIYNRSTVKNILLSSYRKRVPVVGFSRSFVKAGALAGIYSTPEQLATQVRRLIDTFHQNNRFEYAHQHPDDFKVLINNQVSKSLGIKVPSSDEITETLMQETVR